MKKIYSMVISFALLLFCMLGGTGCAQPKEPERFIRFPFEIYCQYEMGEPILENILEYTSDNGADLIVPQKEGYDFVGWSGDGILGQVESHTIPKGAIGKKEFTAHYVEKQVPIPGVFGITIYYDYGTSQGAVLNKVDTYSEDQAYTLPALNYMRLGTIKDVAYKFTGWSGSDIEEGQLVPSYTVPVGSVGAKSYVAHFEKVESVNATFHNVTEDENFAFNVYNIDLQTTVKNNVTMGIPFGKITDISILPSAVYDTPYEQEYLAVSWYFYYDGNRELLNENYTLQASKCNYSDDAGFTIDVYIAYEIWSENH